jgi:hypothetical protein
VIETTTRNMNFHLLRLINSHLLIGPDLTKIIRDHPFSTYAREEREGGSTTVRTPSLVC